MLKNFNIADWYDLKGQVAIITGGATGLGLAIVKLIVAVHHADIEVTSEEDKGTEITVTFHKENE